MLLKFAIVSLCLVGLVRLGKGGRVLKLHTETESRLLVYDLQLNYHVPSSKVPEPENPKMAQTWKVKEFPLSDGKSRQYFRGGWLYRSCIQNGQWDSVSCPSIDTFPLQENETLEGNLKLRNLTQVALTQLAMWPRINFITNGERSDSAKTQLKYYHPKWIKHFAPPEKYFHPFQVQIGELEFVDDFCADYNHNHHLITWCR